MFVGIYKNETGGKKVNFNSSSDINYSKMISASIVNCLAKYYLLLASPKSVGWPFENLVVIIIILLLLLLLFTFVLNFVCWRRNLRFILIWLLLLLLIDDDEEELDVVNDPKFLLLTIIDCLSLSIEK